MKRQLLFAYIVIVGVASIMLGGESECKRFLDSEKWFSNPVAGFCRGIVKPGEIILDQKGALTHKNKWVVNKISFDLSFDLYKEIDSGYVFMMQFAKFKRSPFFGEHHNRGTLGYSYALAVSKDGNVMLVKIAVDNAIEVIHTAGKIDLMKANSLELEVEYDKVYTFRFGVNGDSTEVTDQPQLPEYGAAGFVTFVNMPISSRAILSDIRLDAREVEVEVDEQVHSVYFLEYFDDKVNKFIHWRYNERTQDYAGVNIYCDGQLLEHLKYPADTFIAPFAVPGEELEVRAVNVDGKESDPAFIKLVSDEDKLIEKNFQRVKLKNNRPNAQLVKAQSGEIFDIRGVNYVRLCFGDHSTFIAATDYLPESYDPYDIEAMFRLLKRYNYNTVRVFLTGRGVLNPGIGGYPEFNEPVYRPYVDNLIDFLRKAKKYGIYVLPTFGDGELPLNQYYKPYIEKMIEITGEPGQISSGIPYNSVYLTSPGIEARQILLRNTLEQIKQTDPSLLKAILVVQCQNELSLRASQWPFKLESGKVQTANGKSYDMSDKDSRQRCMDEGLNFYHQKMIEVIKGVDPDLLVAEGVFTLRIAGKDPVKNKGLYTFDNKDDRFPPTAAVLGQSRLDLVDIHIYHVSGDESPSEGYRKDMESMMLYSSEMKRIRTRSAVIMGEFGAFKFMNDSFEEAADNIIETRDACLKDELNGFMIWTLDTFEQQEIYHALDGGTEFIAELNDLYKK